jgi:peptidoglycan/xylan/chitin deacetylase (PgdA/CDA1 family)
MLIRNFLFHRVSDEVDTRWPPMKPALFSAIIEFISRKYSVVALESFLEDPSLFKTEKPIATISFDDGYKDNIEFAAPLLKKYDCPASFYIVTECIDKNIPTWTYLVDTVFQQTKKKELVLAYDFVPAKFNDILSGTDAAVNPLLKEVKPWMKSLSNPQRLLITNEILQQCDDVEIPVGKMMNWDDIRQLDSAGFLIGSHSHTHPMLASLQQESEITEELKISADRIKAELGKVPITISYPIGSFDERVKRLSQEQGYKYGLAVEQKFFAHPSDKMAIPRVELYQEGWWKVKLHLTGNYWNRLRRIVK